MKNKFSVTILALCALISLPRPGYSQESKNLPSSGFTTWSDRVLAEQRQTVKQEIAQNLARIENSEQHIVTVAINNLKQLLISDAQKKYNPAGSKILDEQILNSVESSITQKLGYISNIACIQLQMVESKLFRANHAGFVNSLALYHVDSFSKPENDQLFVRMWSRYLHNKDNRQALIDKVTEEIKSAMWKTLNKQIKKSLQKNTKQLAETKRKLIANQATNNIKVASSQYIDEKYRSDSTLIPLKLHSALNATTAERNHDSWKRDQKATDKLLKKRLKKYQGFTTDKTLTDQENDEKWVADLTKLGYKQIAPKSQQEIDAVYVDFRRDHIMDSAINGTRRAAFNDYTDKKYQSESALVLQNTLTQLNSTVAALTQQYWEQQEKPLQDQFHKKLTKYRGVDPKKKLSAAEYDQALIADLISEGYSQAKNFQTAVDDVYATRRRERIESVVTSWNQQWQDQIESELDSEYDLEWPHTKKPTYAINAINNIKALDRRQSLNKIKQQLASYAPSNTIDAASYDQKVLNNVESVVQREITTISLSRFRAVYDLYIDNLKLLDQFNEDLEYALSNIAQQYSQLQLSHYAHNAVSKIKCDLTNKASKIVAQRINYRARKNATRSLMELTNSKSRTPQAVYEQLFKEGRIVAEKQLADLLTSGHDKFGAIYTQYQLDSHHFDPWIKRIFHRVFFTHSETGAVIAAVEASNSGASIQSVPETPSAENTISISPSPATMLETLPILFFNMDLTGNASNYNIRDDANTFDPAAVIVLHDNVTHEVLDWQPAADPFPSGQLAVIYDTVPLTFSDIMPGNDSLITVRWMPAVRPLPISKTKKTPAPFKGPAILNLTSSVATNNTTKLANKAVTGSLALPQATTNHTLALLKPAPLEMPRAPYRLSAPVADDSTNYQDVTTTLPLLEDIWHLQDFEPATTAASGQIILVAYRHEPQPLQNITAPILSLFTIKDIFSLIPVVKPQLTKCKLECQNAIELRARLHETVIKPLPTATFTLIANFNLLQNNANCTLTETLKTQPSLPAKAFTGPAILDFTTRTYGTDNHASGAITGDLEFSVKANEAAPLPSMPLETLAFKLSTSTLPANNLPQDHYAYNEPSPSISMASEVLTTLELPQKDIFSLIPVVKPQLTKCKLECQNAIELRARLHETVIKPLPTATFTLIANFNLLQNNANCTLTETLKTQPSLPAKAFTGPAILDFTTRTYGTDNHASGAITGDLEFSVKANEAAPLPSMPLETLAFKLSTSTLPANNLPQDHYAYNEPSPSISMASEVLTTLELPQDALDTYTGDVSAVLGQKNTYSSDIAAFKAPQHVYLTTPEGDTIKLGVLTNCYTNESIEAQDCVLEADNDERLEVDSNKLSLHLLAASSALNKTQDLMASEANKLAEDVLVAAKGVRSSYATFNMDGVSGVVGIGRNLTNRTYLSAMGVFSYHDASNQHIRGSSLGAGLALHQKLFNNLSLSAGVSGGAINLGGQADKTQSYFWCYLGLSKLIEFNPIDLTFDVRYHHSHLQGVNISGTRFNAVNSHRVRLGGAISFKEPFVAPFISAAVEREFNTVVKTPFNDHVNHLKGYRGIISVGINFSDSKSLKRQLSIEKYLGSEHGFGGNFAVAFLW